MKGRALTAMALALASLLCPVAASAQAKFRTIDYPGATGTFAMGINAPGDIVGYYMLGGVSHGFFLGKNESSPVSIEVPGACATDAWAINQAGDIVGSYNEQPAAGKACSTGKAHAYLLRQGVFTTIDVPDATFTGAFGINAEGDIVGHFGVAPSGRMNGWLLRNGTFTTYAHADAEAANKMSCGVGIGPQGEIVGHYQDTVGVHGFLLNEAGFTVIDIPGAKGTQAYAINPEGEIVGFYTDLSTNRIFGFVLDRWGSVTRIEAPGSVNTTVRRNNPRGDLVGSYSDATGKQHGWVLRR